MTGSTLLLLTVLGNAVLAGLLLALLPELQSCLAEHFKATARRVQALRILLLALLVPLMLVAGLLIDKWGVQPVLLLGGLGASLAFVTFVRGDAFSAAVGGVALLAAAIAALTVGSIVLMPLAFHQDPVRAANLGYLALMGGALVAGPMARLVHRRFGARKTLLALALVCLVPAAHAALADLVDSAPTITAADPMLPLDMRLGVLLLLVVLAGPLETVLAPWVAHYVRERDYRPAAATLWWAGFWVTFLGTRLAAGLFLPPARQEWWILVLAIVAAVTFGNLLGAARLGSASIFGVWLIGASCGPLMPVLMGLVLQSYPTHAGVATGLANAAAMLSCAALLPWMDASRANWSDRAALRGATILAVALLAPALMLVLLG
jgi:hypothetical protein